MPQAISYQAFLKLLVRWTGPVLIVLSAALRERMETALAARWRIAGYSVFGGDGSLLELPRTASNEARFSPKKSRRKKAQRKKRNQKRKPSRRTAAARRARARQARARQKKADSPQWWITTL